VTSRAAIVNSRDSMNANSAEAPRYDPRQSYDWNYEHAPVELPKVDVRPMPGSWQFCGLPVASPLGIAAGPLLNGRWVLYYAAHGFDVLTYKTVRSGRRECYPLPNLHPVKTVGQINSATGNLPAAEHMSGTWAVSFGMPSQPPDVWRPDVERTRRALPSEKLLSVSVVASPREDWTLEQLAEDYARCAKWAVESGADAVEMNFSCPNVATCDGQLYQQPREAEVVAARARAAIGRTPLVVKIGCVHSEAAAEDLLARLAPHVDALSMTNSVATTVTDENGELLFAGERRGICGDAIRDASIGQVALLNRLKQRRGLSTALIGVGGASTAEHVRAYLAAGADTVHLATAVMRQPDVALSIRRDWPATR
jgi:dihydroorotate dehydrogenase (NAD+) catalytic subunit